MTGSWSSFPFRGSTPGRPQSLWGMVLLLVLLAIMLTACSGGDDTEPAAEDSLDDAAEADGDVGPTDSIGSDRRREVRLGLTDWTGSRINVAIAEILIERRLGYPVTAVPVSEFDEMFALLESRELDAVLELWPSSLNESELAYLSDGRVEDLGPLGVVGQVGWYLPNYVLDANPDLGTWQGLSGPDAASTFATAESAGRGRFVGTDPSYEQFDEELLVSLGLDFDVLYTGSEDGTRTELSLASARQDPILLYWWSPTAEIVEYDLVKVNLPPRTQECLDTHEAGQPMSCDYPTDELFKVGRAGLAEADPELSLLLTSFELSTEDQLAMIYAVERTGRSIADVAADWVADHEQQWSAWLPE